MPQARDPWQSRLSEPGQDTGPDSQDRLETLESLDSLLEKKRRLLQLELDLLDEIASAHRFNTMPPPPWKAMEQTNWDEEEEDEDSREPLSLELFGSWEALRVPEEIRALPWLRHLTLRSFRSPMPTWLADLDQLESLTIIDTPNVDVLLPHLAKLTHLRTLTLSAVDSLTLPASLGKLQQLRNLSLDGSRVGALPAWLADLTALERFSFTRCDCPLEEVFALLARLPGLKSLTISPLADAEHLPPTRLSDSIGRLQALEELHLPSWPGLQELPDSIGTLSRLRVLDIEGRTSPGDPYAATLRSLPDSVCQLANLERLDLYGLKELEQLPAGFVQLSKLKHLDTRCSGLAHVRLTPAQLAQLETLHLAGDLPDLRYGWKLRTFSWRQHPWQGSGQSRILNRGTGGRVHLPNMAALENLETLWIDCDALASANFLAELPKLRSVTLDCDLDRLPAGLVHLHNLEKLSISGARSLTKLPKELGYMPSLKVLTLLDSGLERLPASVRENRYLTITVRGRFLNFVRVGYSLD